MRYKVPQNVDIEDTIIGPLTAKQFIWIVLAAGILYLIYQIVDFSLFLIFLVFIGGTAAVFAFVRPYGQSMFSFTGNFFLYLFKGKEYFWERGKTSFKSKQKRKKEDEILIVKKRFPNKKVEELANVLDTEGDIFNDALPYSAASTGNNPAESLNNNLNYNKNSARSPKEKINASQINSVSKKQNKPAPENLNIEKNSKNNQNIKQVQKLNNTPNNLYQ